MYVWQEAPSHGKPAMYYDKYSAGAKAYLALTGEMLRVVKKSSINAKGISSMSKRGLGKGLDALLTASSLAR